MRGNVWKNVWLCAVFFLAAATAVRKHAELFWEIIIASIIIMVIIIVIN